MRISGDMAGSGPVVFPARGKIAVKGAKVERMVMKGLHVPDVVKERLAPCQGEVVGVGNGVKNIDLGDRVVYGMGVGVEVGEGVVLLRESQVVCKIVAEKKNG